MAANDPFGLTSSGIPPELQAQYRGLTRDQAIQEALLKQSMQPGGGVIDAGMFKVARSPMEGIARVAQAYLARKGLDRTDERMGELGSRAAQMQAEEVRRYQQMKNGVPGMPERPAQIDPQEASQAADGMSPLPGPMPAEPGIPADPRGAVTGAMMSRNPMLQRLGTLDLQQLNRVEDRKDTQDFQRKQAEELAKNRTADIAMRLAEGRITKEESDARMDALRRDLAAQAADSKRELRAMAGASTPITAVTIQDPQNPNATIVVDGRTGKLIGKGPKLTETGKSNFKQATVMQGIGADLQAAEDLLMGQVRDSEGNVTKGNLPTGSGIGSAADSVAGFFGKTLDGAKEADSLKVVAGKLVQKVPRFEGPQSDKDVALYKQMAADAGNEKNTRERRIAAVQKMREIYSGYEDGSRGRVVQEQINGKPPAALAGGIPEGATATGPNGQKIVRRNGAWVPQ